MDPELSLWSIEQERKRAIVRAGRVAGASRIAKAVTPARAARRAWFVRLLDSTSSRRTAARAAKPASEGGTRVHGL